MPEDIKIVENNNKEQQLTPEEKQFIEIQEKNKAAETALIKETKEKVEAMNEEQGLVRNDLEQCFSNQGMFEATAEFTAMIIQDILNVLKPLHQGDIDIKRCLRTNSVQQEKRSCPYVQFEGEEVIIKFVVPPTDHYGVSSYAYLPKDKYEAILKDRERTRIHEEHGRKSE